MPINSNEATRIIEILNKASDKVNATSIDSKDVEVLLKILTDETKGNPFITENESHYNGNGNESTLDESEISRFKQIALAAMRYALSLSNQNDPNLETTCKKIVVSGLLPLTNLSLWIESYIISAIKLLLDHVMYEKNGSFMIVNTSVVELLLPPYIARISPDEASCFIQQLCHIDEANNKDVDAGTGSNPQETKMLNPHAAAALTSSLHEIHKLQSTTNSSPILPPRELSSLVDTLLQSLHTLSKLQEYDSIPPLVYQLCGLTNIVLPTSSQKGGFPGKKDTTLSYKILLGISHFLSTLDEQKEQVRWTICTSLSHLNRILRNNPSLPNVLLNLIKGKKHEIVDGAVDPLRFKRITPMLLAMGLTMASSISRMKTDVLEAVRDLVVEEELIRCKRYSSRWINSTMALLNAQRSVDENGNLTKEVSESILEDVGKYGHEDEIQSAFCLEKKSFMIRCIKRLVLLADGKNDSWENTQGNSVSDAELSTLYPTLISLGFMLVDCVKKDVDKISPGSSGVYTLPMVPSCTSELRRNSMYTAQQKASNSAAKLGRSLLVYLFLRAGESSDSDGVITDKEFSRVAISSPQCRSILQSACEKFCGMAPNAIEHSYILRDLVFDKRHDNRNVVMADTTRLGVHIMEETFTPTIIDLLANIPGGGMPPLVAARSIIPVLEEILKLSAKKGKRNRRKRKELDDHIDHCFLLAKKALFCTDVERRKVAANLLTMLLSVESSRMDTNKSLLDEVKGYLRRCMTQHQYEVRLELYSSFVALVPEMTEDDESAQNLSMPSSQNLGRDNRCGLRPILSQILLNHLERYITVEEDDTIIEARRKRAITHGTHLSQQVDMDDNPCDEKERTCPLRLEMCIASSRSTVSKSHHLGAKRTKKESKSPDILVEATSNISEPISFLIGSCLAMINENSNASASGTSSELHDALISLRDKIADCEVEDCIKWCEGKDGKSSELSTCLLVASICETLMCIPPRSGDIEPESIEKLFRLRTDGVYRAAAILAVAKAKKSKKTKASKGKENSENKDENDSNEEDPLIDSKNRHSRKGLEKFKIIVESNIRLMCPAMAPSFLASGLRKYGILGQPRDVADVLHSTQDEDNESSAASKLSSNEDFRRFLLERCDVLLSGEALLMKLGRRFDVENHCCENLSIEYIGPSFMLGPILFAEFLSLVQNRCFTSLTDQNDTPLACLAFQCFIACSRRMISYVKNHQLSSLQRIGNLLRASIQVVCNHFSSFKKVWESCEIPELGDIPEEEASLIRSIFPFVPILSKSKAGTRCDLLSEFIINGLDDEAAQCSHFLKCVFQYLSPSSRQAISIRMIESFEVLDIEEESEGLLGPDFGNDNVDCQKCSSSVIDAAILLDGLIDGSTMATNLSFIPENTWRKKCGFTTITPSEVKKVRGPTEFKFLDGDKLLGTAYLLASSFTQTLGMHPNFDDEDSDDENPQKMFEFLCTRVVAMVPETSEVVSKELPVASNSLLAAIENGLSDLEFLIVKISPHVVGKDVILLQRISARLFYAIGKLICTTSQSASSFDDNAAFLSTLLKSYKRLYASYTKLLGNLSNYQVDVLTQEHKLFLQLMGGMLNKRAMASLLTLQEKNRVGTKSLGESKISSQGRIAAQLVFEIERCDNALLKLSAKLKSSGFEEESKYVQSKVRTSTIRDFRIKKNEIQAARERADYSKKRKVKAEKKKKSKKKKVVEVDDTEDQITDGAEDQSMGGDEASLLDGTVGEEELSDGDSVVGKFDVNSASEDSSDEETEDEAEADY